MNRGTVHWYSTRSRPDPSRGEARKRPGGLRTFSGEFISASLLGSTAAWDLQATAGDRAPGPRPGSPVSRAPRPTSSGRWLPGRRRDASRLHQRAIESGSGTWNSIERQHGEVERAGPHADQSWRPWPRGTRVFPSHGRACPGTDRSRRSNARGARRRMSGTSAPVPVPTSRIRLVRSHGSAPSNRRPGGRMTGTPELGVAIGRCRILQRTRERSSSQCSPSPSPPPASPKSAQGLPHPDEDDEPREQGERGHNVNGGGHAEPVRHQAGEERARPRSRGLARGVRHRSSWRATMGCATSPMTAQQRRIDHRGPTPWSTAPPIHAGVARHQHREPDPAACTTMPRRPAPSGRSGR